MINKLKKDNKAWLRIIEAFLAALIIFAGVITVIANKEGKSELDKRVYERQGYILDLIQKNESLRIQVMDTIAFPADEGKNSVINLTIYGFIPRAWDYRIKICELNQICIPKDVPATGKDVYYSEKMIVASLDKYSPRKLVLAIWSK